MPDIIVSLILSALIAYLWGSVPSGYWMGKLLRGKDFDIRQYGSRRIGATNVARTLGKIPAIIVFVIDISKGVGPTLLATFVPLLNGAGWGVSVAGLAALLGHCYPVFIGFKGGRGVSTGAGGVLIISPLSFLIAAITAFSTIGISRYVSLGSLVGCLTIFICGIVFYFMHLVTLPQLPFLLVGPLLVAIFHADNIGRLLKGQESKLGQKVTVADKESSNSSGESGSSL